MVLKNQYEKFNIIKLSIGILTIRALIINAQSWNMLYRNHSASVCLPPVHSAIFDYLTLKHIGFWNKQALYSICCAGQWNRIQYFMTLKLNRMVFGHGHNTNYMSSEWLNRNRNRNKILVFLFISFISMSYLYILIEIMSSTYKLYVNKAVLFFSVSIKP